MKTENHRERVAVNCKLCKSVIELRGIVTEVPINPVIRSITRYFRHAYLTTRDRINFVKLGKNENLRYRLITRETTVIFCLYTFG